MNDIDAGKMKAWIYASCMCLLALAGCGGGGGGALVGSGGVVPPNAILYTRRTTNGSLELRAIKPSANMDTLLGTGSSNVAALAINPRVQGQFVYAARLGPNAPYGIYIGPNLTVASDTQLVQPQFQNVSSFQIAQDGSIALFVAALAGNPQTHVFTVDLLHGNGFRFIDDAFEASLAPDNNTILYSKSDNTVIQLFTTRITNGGTTQVTFDSVDHDFPQFSKDASQIVCSVFNVATRRFSLELISADGTALQPLPALPGISAVGASFNDDGTKLSFIGVTDQGHGAVYQANTQETQVDSLSQLSGIGQQVSYWTTANGG
jgi:hypothetical protein